MTLPAPQVLVVGAGVVGASVAWHLAREGVGVLVVERNTTPAAGATGQGFGWVGRAADKPGDDMDLARFRVRAQGDMERILTELGTTAPPVRRGALVWGRDRPDTEALIAWHEQLGSPLVPQTAAQVAALEPGLNVPPPLAGFAPDDIAVEPAELAEALLTGATGLGARVWYDTEITGIESGAAMTAQGEALQAPVIVLATGCDAMPLAAGLGAQLSLTSASGLLIRGTAAPGLANHILRGAELELRQRADGSLLLTQAVQPDASAEPGAVTSALRHGLRKMFHTGATAHLHSVSAVERPMTADGWPLAGFLPGLTGIYVTVADPGVALAPFLGHIAAQDILFARRDADAARFAIR